MVRDMRYQWTDMKRHPANPILCASEGAWDAEWFSVECVLKVEATYYMYYEGSDVGNKNTKLGLAFSDDGIHWTKYKENPIWEGEWEYFLRDVRVYKLKDKYWMYYSDGDRHIDLATSADGIHFTNYKGNPILTPSQNWEDYIMQESVLRLAPNKWYMWYSTYGNKPRETGLATSTDGIHWTKYAHNPVLHLGPSGAWDDYSAFQPIVFLMDGIFHMLYTGSSEEDKIAYRIGCAWSKDGINWVKSPDNPIIDRGDTGSWDAGKVSGHIIYQTGPDSFNIYYSGASAPNATYRGIGVIQGRLHQAEDRKL